MLNALASVVPGFLGGSADLAPSNMTLMKAFGDFQKDSKTGDKDRIGGYAERNLRFGVREHAMGAICNGAATVRQLTRLAPFQRAAAKHDDLSLNRILSDSVYVLPSISKQGNRTGFARGLRSYRSPGLQQLG